MNNPFPTVQEYIKENVNKTIESIQNCIRTNQPLIITKETVSALDYKHDFLEKKSIKDLLNDTGWEMIIEDYNNYFGFETLLYKKDCVKIFFKPKRAN